MCFHVRNGIPDATDFTWYEDNTILRDGELGEIVVDSYEDEYGSHEVRQTLVWTAGSRDDSFELGCKAETDGDEWDDTWAVAQVRVTEEGAGDNSRSGDEVKN